MNQRNQRPDKWLEPVPSDDGAGALASPDLETTIEGMGLTYLGMAEPQPITVPAPLFARIQRLDREQADVTAQKQDLMELAVDLLEIDRAIYGVSISLDTGVVTLIPLGDAPHA